MYATSLQGTDRDENGHGLHTWSVLEQPSLRFNGQIGCSTARNSKWRSQLCETKEPVLVRKERRAQRHGTTYVSPHQRKAVGHIHKRTKVRNKRHLLLTVEIRCVSLKLTVP